MYFSVKSDFLVYLLSGEKAVSILIVIFTWQCLQSRCELDVVSIGWAFAQIKRDYSAADGSRSSDTTRSVSCACSLL